MPEAPADKQEELGIDSGEGDEDDGGIETWLIVVIASGAIVFIVAIIAIVMCIRKKSS